jgi:hypothetical protein
MSRFAETAFGKTFVFFFLDCVMMMKALFCILFDSSRNLDIFSLKECQAYHQVGAEAERRGNGEGRNIK